MNASEAWKVWKKQPHTIFKDLTKEIELYDGNPVWVDDKEPLTIDEFLSKDWVPINWWEEVDWTYGILMALAFADVKAVTKKGTTVYIKHDSIIDLSAVENCTWYIRR